MCTQRITSFQNSKIIISSRLRSIFDIFQINTGKIDIMSDTAEMWYSDLTDDTLQSLLVQEKSEFEDLMSLDNEHFTDRHSFMSLVMVVYNILSLQHILKLRKIQYDEITANQLGKRLMKFLNMHIGLPILLQDILSLGNAKRLVQLMTKEFLESEISENTRHLYRKNVESVIDAFYELFFGGDNEYEKLLAVSYRRLEKLLITKVQFKLREV